MYWLSVVLPSFRGERWIATALSSIAEQADEGIEVIVVDGDANPAARRIAAAYQDQMRVCVFERPDLTSWQAKTNLALRESRAPYACWLGSDDIWLPKRASSVRAWIRDDPDSALHLAPASIIDARGRRMGCWRCPLPAEVRLDPGVLTDRLLVQNFVAAPAPVFKRDAWLKTGGFDEHLWYTADWDMWLKLSKAGPVRYHQDLTVGFRIHADSLTSSGGRTEGELGRQMQAVVARHGGAAPASVLAAADASIAVNDALAAMASGRARGTLSALWRLLRLGPLGVARYLQYSRIIERIMPRLRAKFGV